MREAKPVVQSVHLDILDKMLEGRGFMSARSGVARRLVAAALLPIALAACGLAQSNQIAAMPPEQLVSLSDRFICQGLLFNRANANLQAEVTKRQLGDCAPDHFSCASWGAGLGSQAYVQCRSQLRAAARVSQAIQAIETSPQSKEPRCVSVASGATPLQGASSSTTCY